MNKLKFTLFRVFKYSLS